MSILNFLWRAMWQKTISLLITTFCIWVKYNFKIQKKNTRKKLLKTIKNEKNKTMFHFDHNLFGTQF